MVVEAYGKGKLVRRAALSWLELRGSENGIAVFN
jgi:hypothetical protein